MSLSVTRRTVPDAGRGGGDCGLRSRKRHGEQEHKHGRPARRRRQHVRPAARITVAGGLPVGEWHQHRVPADRFGRRDPGNQQPHRRFRCFRCASDAGSAHQLQGVRPDPVGARRYFGDGEPEDERARTAAYDWPGAGEDLPRSGHELGRPGNQGAEPRHLAPEPEDHPGLSLRRFWHLVQLHGLPVQP